MSAPLIAVVGSYDPKREQELGLRNLSLAPTAGEYLGRAFANQGFHIVVYASYAHLLEVDVVRGYAGVKNTSPDAIQVRYSQAFGRPSFPEEKEQQELFTFQPDTSEDWEISFYDSLTEVDGVLLLGGGPSALIAGLFAFGHSKPILVCSGFGGASQKVWNVLKAQQYLMTPKEMNQMAEERWTTELAEQLVKSLDSQMKLFTFRKEERIKAERERIMAEIVVKQKESINITRHALVAVILFILGIAAWPIAWGIPDLGYAWLLCLLIGAPLFAGASGATIRIVVDWLQGKEQAVGQSVIRNGALGFIIGGISALLFVLAQVFANPTDLEATIKAEQLGRLVPFVISIGFIAGLTLEAVYKRLRETSIVDTSPIEPTKKVSPTDIG